MDILSEIAEMLGDLPAARAHQSSADAQTLHSNCSVAVGGFGLESVFIVPYTAASARRDVVPSSGPTMKPTVVSADALFEEFRATLKWQWVAGLGASERRFDEVAVRQARSGADLVGYPQLHPPIACKSWVNARSPYQQCRLKTAHGASHASSRWSPQCWCCAKDKARLRSLLALCERAQIPMFATHESPAFWIDVLRAYLSKHFAERVSIHGVFMDILGMEC